MGHSFGSGETTKPKLCHGDETGPFDPTPLKKSVETLAVMVRERVPPVDRWGTRPFRCFVRRGGGGSRGLRP